MEETIERIVGFFRHAAQGLEERKQILYLLGPVGGGKSSLAERLKALVEKFPDLRLEGRQRHQPVVRISAGAVPAGSVRRDAGRQVRYSAPAPDRADVAPGGEALDEFEGDISRFKVVRLQPSRLKADRRLQDEPGDENNQDISSLVGKVDIRKLEFLNRTTRTPIPIRAA